MSTHKHTIVVLVHNQATNIPRLVDAYRSLVLQPDLFVFVCDRCTDDSVALLSAADMPARKIIVETSGGVSFQAGRNRDLGASTAESEIGETHLVFLDGDCVPAPELLLCYTEIFEAAGDYPVVAAGRRVNETPDGRSREDNRFLMPSSMRTVFHPGTHRLVAAREPVFGRLATWSCNLGVSASAVKLIRGVNWRLDKHATIFNDSFNGHWGGEDDFVGITAWFLGAAVVAADPVRCRVDHIYHKSRESTEFTLIMQRKLERLRHLMTRLKAPGVCFARTDVSVLANEVARKAMTSEPPPTLATAMSDIPLDRRSVYWQALAAHTAITGPLLHVSQAGVDVSLFRQEMEAVTTSVVDAMLVLPGMKYTFKPTTPEAACNICGSNSGFTAAGSCLSCRSTPTRRMARALVGDRTASILGSRLPCDTTAFKCTGQADVVVSADHLDASTSEAGAVADIMAEMAPGGQAVLAFKVTSRGTVEKGAVRDSFAALHSRRRNRLYGLHDVRERLQAAGLSIRPVFAADMSVPGTAADDVVFVAVPDTYEVGAPQRLYLDVFDGCNYACKSCNIHLLRDAGGLDIDLYKTAISEFAEMGGREVHFQSGETWLRKSVVVDLAKHVRACGIEPHLITNGSVIREGDADDLALFQCVNISLDSHVAQQHDEARGVPGAFAKAIDAMAIVSKVTRVQAALVLTQKNFHTLPDYTGAMLRSGFNGVIFNVVEPDFNGGFFNTHPYYDENRITDVDGLEAVLRRCMVEFSAGFNVDAAYVAHTLGSLRGDPYCGASMASILLGRDGRVRTCAHKPEIGWYVPGSLRAIWNGPKARTRREHDKHCGRPCATGNCNRS